MLNGGKTHTAQQGQSQARVGCAARSRHGRARGCGVPALAADAFDKVGGMIFVPVRYATPHVPEFGLPCDAAGCYATPNLRALRR